MFMLRLHVFTFLFPAVFCQISPPNPQFLPPNSSAGTSPSITKYPNQQWSTLLGNALYFYDAQRSGNLPSNNRVSWRNSSSTDDGKDVGLDLSGGYYDAGDYIKATFPLSFTLMSVCWGAIEYGKGYDLASQTAYLDSMLRWGLDWLIKAHPSSDVLYVLVGDPDTDNAYWGGDRGIPAPRKSYAINSTNPGTDAAAGASAAFSACSRLYSGASFGGQYSSPASLSNSTYAGVLLKHAQDLYTFAVNATGGQKTYQTSVPAVADAYGSSTYGDELTIAALFLSWASNSTALYQQALNYYNAYGIAGQDAVFNWDSKTPAIPILFAQLAQAGFGSNFTSYQKESERYLDRIVNKQVPTASYTGGGLLWYAESEDASLNPALNAAMLMAKYSPMASTPDKRAIYNIFSESQMQYALGKNPMNVPYVVGINPNAPSNPHSAPASGGSDIGQIDTSPEQESYVLYGAVVGGPDKKDKFYNIRSDWPQTEVALDYNAPLLTLTAMHVLYNSSDPFYVSLQDGAYLGVKPAGQPCDSAISAGCQTFSLPQKARIGVYVTISVIALIIGFLLAYYIWTGHARKAT